MTDTRRLRDPGVVPDHMRGELGLSHDDFLPDEWWDMAFRVYDLRARRPGAVIEVPMWLWTVAAEREGLPLEPWPTELMGVPVTIDVRLPDDALRAVA